MNNILRDPNSLKVIAVLILNRGTMSTGLRSHDIQDKTRMSQNAVECTLQSLVDMGFVAFKILQTGTGGSTDTFYTAKENIELRLAE